MKQKRGRPLLILLGLFLALAAAIAVLVFFMPASMNPGMKKLVFFGIVIVIYFFVILIGCKFFK